MADGLSGAYEVACGLAKQLGIAHNNAKVKLRSVFAKTGGHRQAQLVALRGTLSG